MHYTIYKTTNLKNGKFYIGKHQTEDLDDGYLGSGTILAKAILKHGKENFKKEILFDFASEYEMNEKEKELVDLLLVEDPNCYNIALGGKGGCICLFEGHPKYEEIKKKLSVAASARREELIARAKENHKVQRIGMYGKTQTDHQKRVVSEANRGVKKTVKQIEKWKASYSKTTSSEDYIHPLTGVEKSEDHKKNISKNHADVSRENNPMFGKSHTEEARKKISEKMKTSETYVCPFCSKAVRGSNYFRWHGENCKMHII